MTVVISEPLHRDFYLKVRLGVVLPESTYVVNDDGVVVRRSDGSSFLPNEFWTEGADFGSRGTFFADVTGN